MSKIDNWVARGKRPLSDAEIRSTLERLPRFIPMPREVIVLDGVLEVGDQIAVGANPQRTDPQTIILSPLADEETLVHEVLHTAGLGEMGAYAISPLLTRRVQNGIMPNMRPRRKVDMMQDTPPSSQELMSRFTIDIPSQHFYEEMQCCLKYNAADYKFSLPPDIKRYRVVNP